MTQRHIGKLTRWIDDRGFGFITPDEGKDEVFVHISAFPRGQKPRPGDDVSYELQRAEDGRLRACKAILPNRLHLEPVAPDRGRRTHRTEAARAQSTPPEHRHNRRTHARQNIPMGRVMLLVLATVIGAMAFHARQRPSEDQSSLIESPAAAAPASTPLSASRPTFTCDGRTHCSQMRSCVEAKFFLRNCPGTEMDGDHDGIPCESQHCDGW